MRVSWGSFKAFVESKKLSIQYVEDRKKYLLQAFDGNITIDCVLPAKDVADSGSDQEDFETNFQGAANQSPGTQGLGPQFLKSDFLIETNFTPQALSETYQDFSSHSGSGYIWGFKADFSNTQTSFRIVADGQNLFDLNVQELESFNFRDYDDTGLNPFFRFAEYGVLEFFPPLPIRYFESYAIQFKKNVSWGINLDKRMFWVTKE